VVAVDDRRELLPVDTCLEDIEVGDEITLPVGTGADRWIVRATGTEPMTGLSGVTRTVVRLDCVSVEDIERGDDTGVLQFVQERLFIVPRWVPLADLVEAFQWDTSDPENRDCAAAVIPALVNRVRELTKRVDSAETRLDESRRARRLAEQAFGGRGKAKLAESARYALGSPAGVAEYLGVTPKTLAQWRSQGKGPRYRKAGGFVRYRWADVDRWFDAQEGGGVAAPAFDLPQVTVTCPTCHAEPGDLCTSHGDTRAWRHDVHQDRTTAWREIRGGAPE